MRSLQGWKMLSPGRWPVAGQALRRGTICLAGIALLAVMTGRASAAPVLTFDETTGHAGIDRDQSVGWQFDVVSPLLVTGLGWFDQGADGLASAHTVGIWDPTGALLASVLVPAGTVATLDGQFRTVAITPLLLSAGAGYIVGGENFSASADRLATDAVHVVDPRITYIDATYSQVASGFTRPTNFSTASTGFYGPSFSVADATVPEPGVLALGGGYVVLSLLGYARRRRSRETR